MGNKNITTTACGHTFCFSCITKSMDAKNACPCCRAPLREQVEEESVMNPFEDEDEWSDDGLDFDILDDTNEPSNGLVSVQEIMEFANEQGITFVDVLSSHFCRYDSGDGNEVKEKYHLLDDFVRKKDRERRRELSEQTAMMEEDALSRPRKLSLIHPDLLDSFTFVPFQDTPVPSSLRSFKRLLW
jgi:hypothetical protein